MQTFGVSFNVDRVLFHSVFFFFIESVFFFFIRKTEFGWNYKTAQGKWYEM